MDILLLLLLTLMYFVLIDELTDFDVLEVRAGHSLVKVGEVVEDFLRGFVVVVIFDDFKV